MALNIEIKANCAKPSQIILRIKNMDILFLGEDFQTDTFYRVPRGRLKIRESTLSEKYSLIPYFRDNTSGPKDSYYSLIDLNNPEQVKDLFEKMFSILCVVRKRRLIYIYKNVRIHLDHVEGLGDFIELEAVITSKKQQKDAQSILNFLMKEFNIQDNDLITNSYADLLNTH